MTKFPHGLCPLGCGMDVALYTDPAMLEGVYAEATDLPNKPYPSIEGLKNMQAVYPILALTRKKPEDFVDASFVTELDKSGYIDSLYKQANAGAAK